MRADIHDGQEHERSIHGPDTKAQDQSPPSLTSDLQHTAGVPINVRCYSDSDIIVRRSEVTPRARNGHLPMTWRRASRWLVQCCGTLLQIGKPRALPPNLQRILAVSSL